MRFPARIARTAAIGAALAGCDGTRSHAALAPCDEAAASTLETTAWRPLDGGAFPSLALPARFAPDRSLAGPLCLHGGMMWRDTTVVDGRGDSRYVGWCIEDRMPPIDSPDSVLRRLPPRDLPTDPEPGDALCALSFPVLGQRMALWRAAEDADTTAWRWYTLPIEHGEPLYLLARSPARGDEAVVIRALRDMRWSRRGAGP